jgi:hypothetical protein
MIAILISRVKEERTIYAGNDMHDRGVHKNIIPFDASLGLLPEEAFKWASVLSVPSVILD